MMDKANVSIRLNTLGFQPSVLDCYEEPHRYYHTAEHLAMVLKSLGSDISDDELFLAAVYHDAVYDPKKTDNEVLSADLFMTHAVSSNLSADSVKNIQQMILDTKTHVASSAKSNALQRADLYILEAALPEQIEYEHQVFREFQFLDYPKYREERMKVLTAMNGNGKLNDVIKYVELRRPSIGVFCGSFNPFHRGHLNVLEKAEKIFDKVIIAFGNNPEKTDRLWPRPKALEYHQVEDYSGLMTDFISSLMYPVVVIRGLRNSTDFQYEQNQYRYLQELLADIRIVNIFCDKEFEHISSSGIRTLQRFDKHHKYLLE